MKNEDLTAKIGEIKIGKKGDVLKATLGSCVGIAMLWKDRNVYGLAHCLLPEAPTSIDQVGAKYVSWAVPSLIKLMKIDPSQFKEVEVYVAGGANMMEHLFKSNSQHIGKMNSDLAVKLLEENGFKIKCLEIGGNLGRQIIIHTENDSVEVRSIERKREVI